MSLIDFTASLFRDQQLADAFNDNPVQALRDAGLPDVTPADVHAMLPTVAESMPPDHPLQSWVRPAETSPVVGPEPVDPSVKHYYQLQPGDQVIDGVAGQTIMRPDGTNVTLDNNDVILQPDEKVFVMQPGDQAIPGINGMVIQHPDGSVTDVGIDTTIVHEDEAYVAGADPNTTKAEEIGEGGMDPRVTTTAEDLGGPDTEWTPHEESMDWDNLEPAVLPTTPPELGLGEDPRDSVGIESDDDVAIETDVAQPSGEDNGLGDIEPNFGLEPGDPRWTHLDPNMPGAENPSYSYDPNVYNPDAPNESTLIANDPLWVDHTSTESQPAEAANIPYHYETESSSEQSDTYAADQSGYESTSTTEPSAGSEFIG